MTRKTWAGPFRKVARGIYTTAPRGTEAVKGRTVLVERHEAAFAKRPPAIGTSQPYWWTWTIAGGITDGKPYPTRQDAYLAAVHYAGLDEQATG